MSHKNVEIVRASWDAWHRGDMQALFDFYDPEVEWDMTHAYVPGMGVYHGPLSLLVGQ
jgi:ketosteroid isomerase-like protein